MSEFITRCCVKENRFEIIFKTSSKEDYEKVEDLCRELMGHDKSNARENDK